MNINGAGYYGTLMLGTGALNRQSSTEDKERERALNNWLMDLGW